MTGDITPIRCPGCDKLLVWEWQIETEDGYHCYKCDLPLEEKNIKKKINSSTET